MPRPHLSGLLYGRVKPYSHWQSLGEIIVKAVSKNKGYVTETQERSLST
jgi:hypothetical protein